jgi:hypothetical protein
MNFCNYHFLTKFFTDSPFVGMQVYYCMPMHQIFPMNPFFGGMIRLYNWVALGNFELHLIQHNSDLNPQQIVR